MYAGHKSEDGRVQPLKEHLEKTQWLCGEFARGFGCESIARLLGLCHDIGKYSPEVQNRILNDGPKRDHSTAGGKELAKLAGCLFSYVIFGHHGGLNNGGSRHDTGAEATMYGRLKKENIPDYSAFRTEIKLLKPENLDFVPFDDSLGFSVAFLIRMLFSCLVDSDFLDTESFMSNRTVKRGEYDDIESLHNRLEQFLETFKFPSGNLNRKRNEILKSCCKAAAGDLGLYSLTVPTGGGKTISSFAFALKHAKIHNLKRVIYVIPYTSIIEQNAKVFSKIVGKKNVLEHHSNIEYDNEEGKKDQKYLSTENWDAPIIVTTNVQFFESLFASKTSRCRKLHNIANSCIIFDEAQMLPVSYLKPCIRAISELIHSYGCTAVLCTATQPSLDQFLPDEIKRNEIVDAPEELYTFFRRVTIENLGLLNDESLFERLQECEQVLCIVNTRKQAQNLFRMLTREEGCYHLSTLMTPIHRKWILRKIRGRLKQGKSCRVVSTSLIEAGVDVDFPVVYRGAAGLDSVIQAAGRCNREGKRAANESKVYVFEPDGKYTIPISQQRPAKILQSVSRNHDDIASLSAIKEYFEMWYRIEGNEVLDEKKIIKRFNDGMQTVSFPFKDVAEEFNLINNITRSIVIPLGEKARRLADELRGGKRTRSLLRKAGQYSVNVYMNHWKELYEMGIIEIIDDELAILSEEGSYDKDVGLLRNSRGGKALFVEV
ncbi:MAG: CRISPR-associated helicase Cas3' [Clostridiales Family XIII bacterium]|jgi:CRISPR-associated endonuclease/helicase Cas3|nr:CRISPR-associated helicase Cas3' [Clostridiales Family XIII bacterium]